MRLFLLYTLFLPFFLISQGGFRSKCYAPNSFNHNTKDIFETSPGNYIAAGISTDTMNGSTVYLLRLMGLNSQGKVQWIKTYGGVKLQFLYFNISGRTFHKSGNYLFYTGCIKDSTNKQIGILMKFDFNGNKLWQQIYRDPSMDVIPEQACSSVDGGHLITGFFQDWVNNVNPTLLIKTDANGNELWRKKLNKAAPNIADGKAILQDSATKKIVIGGFQNIGNEFHDNIIVLDSLGNILSQNSFYPGECLDLIQTRDKKIIAASYIASPGAIPLQLMSYAIKFDINNPTVPIWQVLHPGGTYWPVNYFYAITELKNGNLLIGGGIDTLQLADKRGNVWSKFVWLSPSGQVLKTSYYDYATNKTSDFQMRITSISETSDGGWITSIQMDNNGNNPMFYVKYDSTGCDSSKAYCKALWAGFNENKIQKSNIKIWPNPTNNSLMIELADNFEYIGSCKVRLINVLGQSVVEKSIEFNAQEASLNITDLAAGVYLLIINDLKGQNVYQTKIIKE